MIACEFRPHMRQQGIQHHLRHVGEGAARGDRCAKAGAVIDIVEDLRAQAELLVIGPAAGEIQHVLKIARGGEDQFQILRQFVAPGQRRHEFRIQHPVEQHRVLRQLLGEVRRHAHDPRDQFQKARMRREQGEELHPGGELLQEDIKAGEGGVRVAGIAQAFQQPRHQPGQRLLRPHGARRPVAAMVPFANFLRDGGRILEPQLGEGIEGFRVILRPGEDEPPGLAVRCLLEREEGVVMALHGLQRRTQLAAECVRLVIAEKHAEFAKRRRIVGQELGLLVMGHL